jgi:hypothetical protein
MDEQVEEFWLDYAAKGETERREALDYIVAAVHSVFCIEDEKLKKSSLATILKSYFDDLIDVKMSEKDIVYIISTGRTKLKIWEGIKTKLLEDIKTFPPDTYFVQSHTSKMEEKEAWAKGIAAIPNEMATAKKINIDNFKSIYKEEPLEFLKKIKGDESEKDKHCVSGEVK